MSEKFTEFRICRSICDGQRGYAITYPNTVEIFRFGLAEALNELARALGHGTDREVMVLGEPEEGNVW